MDMKTPWQLENDEDTLDSWLVRDAMGLAMAELPKGSTEESKESQRQRGALMAAAPDLLEALQAMLDGNLWADAEGLWYFEKSDTEDGQAAVRKARAAIAKALGQK